MPGRERRVRRGPRGCPRGYCSDGEAAHLDSSELTETRILNQVTERPTVGDSLIQEPLTVDNPETSVKTAVEEQENRDVDVAQQTFDSQGQMTTVDQTLLHKINDVMQTSVSNLGQVVESAIEGISSNLEKLVVTLSESRGNTDIVQTSQYPLSPTQNVQTNERSRTSVRGPVTFRRTLSNSSDNSDDSLNTINSSDRSSRRDTRMKSSSVKLPPYTGKEKWIVWFNRFSDVAARKGWSTSKKLDELLPRLHGVAGEFVFDQLDPETRRDYKTLVVELENRFKVVHTHRTYAAAFSHRNQKPGESVEDYAAELRRLYSKAHARRDITTREEDLLRRFFDGLSDDKARTQVEYVKDPKTLSEAVAAVVGYLEASKPLASNLSDKKRSVRFANMVRPADDDDESDEEDDTTDATARMTRQGNSRPVPSQKNSSQKVDETCLSEIAKLRDELLKKNDTVISKINDLETKQINQLKNNITTQESVINQRLSQLENSRSASQNRPTNNYNSQKNRSSSKYQGPRETKNKQNSTGCFRCGGNDHYIRNCKIPAVMGQFQMSAAAGNPQYNGGYSNQYAHPTQPISSQQPPLN